MARMLGMVDPVQSLNSEDKFRPEQPQANANLSQWPLLFHSLRQEAEQVWCEKSRIHAEVNSEEILAVNSVTIQAGNQAMEEQLRSWYLETDEPHLIQWMMNGPFNTVLIRAHLNFDSFSSLSLADRIEEPSDLAVSAYSREGYPATQAVFHICIQSHWMPRPLPPVVTPEFRALDILVQDSAGQRRLHIHHPLVIFGSNKAQDQDPGGNESVKAEEPGGLVWQGESAKFIHVQALHASGIHLMLRSNLHGFDIQDLDSTNGTFLQEEKLPPGQTVSSSLPLSLGLGGPTTDPVDLTACVQISIEGTSVNWQQHATPLRRTAVDQPALPMLELLVMDGLLEIRIPVNKFPFEIGRDSAADWTVPAEHAMVSRRHLILQSFDKASQHIQILDVSRHGLTASPEGFAASPKSGTWVETGQTVILGRINAYTGISMRFQYVNL